MIEVALATGAREAYTGWRVALMEIEALGPRTRTPELEAEARRVEDGLRKRLGGKSRKELATIHPLDAYSDHFERWGKAYPVLIQAEAIASKGRRLEMPDPLVLAMFAAELDGLLLTAAHDSNALRPPLVLDEADGRRPMPTLGGAEKTPPVGDLVMRDSEGIVASVLLGPDSRTSVSPSTSRSLFVVYAPFAISEAELAAGLDRVAATVRLACPGAKGVGRRIVGLGRGTGE